MSKNKKFELTDQQVNFLKVAGIGLGAFLLYKTITKTTKSFTDFFSGKETEKEFDDGVDEEIDELKKKGMELSYPLYVYKTYASQLKNAMGGIGTDEDTIYKTFEKIRNDLDMAQLIKSYGLQRYIISPVRFLKIDLAGWIYEELNENEISKLNEILTKNNITYRF
jgi:hypothetical protein